MTEIHIDSVAVTHITPSPVFIQDSVPISAFSPMQSTDKGVAVTPSQHPDGIALVFLPHQHQVCCPLFKPLAKSGFGPGEAANIISSSRTVDGDTLLFYSASSDKFSVYNSKLELVDEWKISQPVMSGGFAYHSGTIVSGISPEFNDGYLLRVTDPGSEEYDTAVPARIPAGRQPAIRNVLSAIAAVPDGFALSFVGDKSVNLADISGVVHSRLVLGKDDPLPESYTVSNPMNAPRGKAYISKIEFYDHHVFILMSSEVWILSYPDFKLKSRLVVNTDDVKGAGVSDFTVGSELVYLTIGRGDIYRIPVNQNWFR